MAISCEFEFMEYIDEDSIDPNLMCTICHKAFKDPVCTSCDHTYGRACITHWLNTNSVSSCPTCVKQPLLIKDLSQASRPLRNMLDQLRVRCTLCEQTGLQRGNFNDHINKVCPKAIVSCRAADIKCPWNGPRDELHDHVLTCVFEPLRPVLASLIADNRHLTSRVQKNENEIEKLTQIISQKNNAAVNNSDDESDGSSVSEFSVGDPNQKEEDAIFIRNLPGTIKFNDLFDFFSKVGRIKYNVTNQQAQVFVFKNPTRKDGPCTAKVIYVDKKSANTAVTEFDGKHIPQWNTRIQVGISQAKKKNMKDFGKDKNEGNTGVHHEAKASGDSQKAPDLDSIFDQLQPPSDSNQGAGQNNARTRRRPRNAKHGDKPTN